MNSADEQIEELIQKHQELEQVDTRGTSPPSISKFIINYNLRLHCKLTTITINSFNYVAAIYVSI